MVRREAGTLSAREIYRFVRDVYSVDAAEAVALTRATTEAWLVRSLFGAFVLKRFSLAARDAAEREPVLVAYLRSMQVPAAHFLSANDGSFISDCHGQPAHLQTYVEGTSVAQNQASPRLMAASANMLWRLCHALAGYRGLPDGFPPSWFSFDARRKTLEYDALVIAVSRNRRLPASQRREIADDLGFKRSAMAALADVRLAPRAFTRGPRTATTQFVNWSAAATESPPSST